MYKTWPENYGEKGVPSEGSSGSLRSGLQMMQQHPPIFFVSFEACVCVTTSASHIGSGQVGCIQSLFEGSMFIFVFMWTPVMESATTDPIPHGQVRVVSRATSPGHT